MDDIDVTFFYLAVPWGWCDFCPTDVTQTLFSYPSRVVTGSMVSLVFKRPKRDDTSRFCGLMAGDVDSNQFTTACEKSLCII